MRRVIQDYINVYQTIQGFIPGSVTTSDLSWQGQELNFSKSKSSSTLVHNSSLLINSIFVIDGCRTIEKSSNLVRFIYKVTRRFIDYKIKHKIKKQFNWNGKRIFSMIFVQHKVHCLIVLRCLKHSISSKLTYLNTELIRRIDKKYREFQLPLRRPLILITIMFS